jgi:hypothetical protein
MDRILRKGSFQFELNHEFGTDTIRAVEACVNVADGIAIFKAKLKPVSDNQTIDANHSKEKDFRNIEFFSFIDTYIRKRLTAFIANNRQPITSWKLEIEYGQKYLFSCKLQSLNKDGVMFHPV